MTKVVVIGGGNAALCAALSASQQGAEVTVLECAPEAQRGGNTAFTAGSIRVPFRGMDDIKRIVPDLSDAESALDIGSYESSEFYDDIARVTEYRSDPELAEVLAQSAFETVCWMADNGVRFLPKFSVSDAESGKFSFKDDPLIETSGGGPGLVAALTNACIRAGAGIHYETRATRLCTEGSKVVGVYAICEGVDLKFDADSVILASGGFEANAEWRSRYLGPNWDLAKVRGSMFNTGDGIRMALEIGASPAGHWSGCHAVGWDYNAPAFGDLNVGSDFSKHSYPFSVMVNTLGRRFVDEGADFRNFTYAKYGRKILEQPNLMAWQVFDQKVSYLLRREYSIRQITKVKANTLAELGELMDGVDVPEFLRTIEEFNTSVNQDVPFQPSVKDGRGTVGLTLPKSNWANTIDEPPYEAYAVTCGVTFTFGGLRINRHCQVLDNDMKVIHGLFAAGELVGGIFYFNYPGGSGLTNGAVFGRIAGISATKV